MSFSWNQNHDLAGALPQLPILKKKKKKKKTEREDKDAMMLTERFGLQSSSS